MKQWKVKDVMTREVVTVGPEAPYQDVVSTLAQHGVSAVPVVDDFHRVLGVVSEADLLRKIEYTGTTANHGSSNGVPAKRIGQRHTPAPRPNS
jgi:CBS domain-containing protein